MEVCGCGCGSGPEREASQDALTRRELGHASVVSVWDDFDVFKRLLNLLCGYASYLG